MSTMTTQVEDVDESDIETNTKENPSNWTITEIEGMRADEESEAEIEEAAQAEIEEAAQSSPPL